MNQTMTIRLLRPEEMDEAVKLADSVFRANKRISMGRSLPKVFSQSLAQALGCFVGGKLVSLAGLVPSIVRIGEARISVISYGAVCTHPDYRGNGCASLILQAAKEHAERSGASLLLVSGVLPLYTKAGCCLFGSVGRYALLPEHAASLTKAQEEDASAANVMERGRLVCREAGSADWFRLHELAAARDVRYEQSLWDLADLIYAGALAAVRNMEQRTFIAERDGVPTAFCTIGAPDDAASGGNAASARGAVSSPGANAESTEGAANSAIGAGDGGMLDGARLATIASGTNPVGLQSQDSPSLVSGCFVSEYAGDAADTAALFAFAADYLHADKLDVVVPWHEWRLNARLGPSIVSTESNQGTVYIVDAERLFQQASVFWRFRVIPGATGELPAIQADGGDSFRISIGTASAGPFTAQQLISLLFDPAPCAYEHDADWAEAAVPFFPLPFPYTKGLNFV